MPKTIADLVIHNGRISAVGAMKAPDGATIIDAGGLRSLHAQVKEHPGRKPLADIKLMKEDAEGAEKASEEIKARYQKLFRV